MIFVRRTVSEWNLLTNSRFKAEGGVQEFAEYFLSVLNEIDYYFYLVDKHELEENVLKYDWAKLFDQLDYFYPIYEIAREGLKSTTRERLIEESWDRLRKSPWTGPYLPRKQT